MTNDLAPRLREFAHHDQFGYPVTTQYIRLDEYERLRTELETMTRSRNEYFDCYTAQRATVMRASDEPKALKCQHDLQLPKPTIVFDASEAIATCTVCRHSWSAPL